jgi:dienelactone hydrolase
MTMPSNTLDSDDPLTDFAKTAVTFNNVEKTVYVGGAGPAVIVMTEMPGISPHVARFARWVRDAGFTVYLPSLFGRDGAVPQAGEGAAVFQRACISAEFRALANHGPSPVTHWLRALSRQVHHDCGGPGVGAIGMCFTGNFALSMMLDHSMVAPVLAQPSLPLDDPAGLESPPEELAKIRDRLKNEDLTVLAYRFQGDQICKAERFAAYADALGERFQSTTLPDSAAGDAVSPFFSRHVPYPHSVLTQHLIDTEGEPTIRARDDILAFFRMRLQPGPP